MNVDNQLEHKLYYKIDVVREIDSEEKQELKNLKEYDNEIKMFNLNDSDSSFYSYEEIELPQPNALLDSHHSLEPDIMMGWRPKIGLKTPIYLCFDEPFCDDFINTMINIRVGAQFQLIYLGDRPINSYIVHQQYSGIYKFVYMDLLNDYKLLMRQVNNEELNYIFDFIYEQKKEVRFKGMNPKLDLKNELQFDSNFESGNLDCVIKVDENEYDLYMRVDSNTKGHNQWYNFKIFNGKQNQKIKINICNFTKKESLFRKGMKPYIKQKSNQKWKQLGEDIQYTKRDKKIYDKPDLMIIHQISLIFDFLIIDKYNDDILNNLISILLLHDIYQLLKNVLLNFRKKQFYQLSFTYTFENDDDEIQIAYCIPYTYSDLTNYLNQLMNSYGKLINKSILCETLSGIEIPVLTITDKNQNSDKNVIVISARIHPGESNSSWIMQGVINYIVSQECQQSGLLSKTIFKIIPMLNPDGVIIGNYRSGFAGKDLNRIFFDQIDQMLYPVAYNLTELMNQLQNQYGQNLTTFIDIHGHSSKENVFIYGPSYQNNDSNYKKCRIIPNILDSCSDMFSLQDCLFKLSKEKQNTARGKISKNNKLVNCYTIEGSLGSYRNKNKKQVIQIKIWDFYSQIEFIQKTRVYLTQTNSTHYF